DEEDPREPAVGSDAGPAGTRWRAGHGNRSGLRARSGALAARGRRYQDLSAGHRSCHARRLPLAQRAARRDRRAGGRTDRRIQRRGHAPRRCGDGGGDRRAGQAAASERTAVARERLEVARARREPRPARRVLRPPAAAAGAVRDRHLVRPRGNRLRSRPWRRERTRGRFQTAGKPIASIEDGNAVLRSLLAINEAVLIKELDRELSRWNGASPAAMFVGAPTKRVAGQDDSLLAQEHAWAQGEEVDVRDQMFGPAGFGPAMGKILLDNRNRAWAAWLENRLAEPGTLLVAVGAAHLAGHNSVHAMLTKRGLTSKRLN